MRNWENLLVLQLKSTITLQKDICEILKYLSPVQALFHLRKSGLLLQGFICGTDLYIEPFFSVPIEFLSNQRLKGQDHFNMEGHALPHPLFSCCLLLLGILLRFYFLILLNSFEEEHESLSDSEKQELKLYRRKNVVVPSRTHPINVPLLPSLLR